MLDEAILDNAGIEQFMPDWMRAKHLGVDSYLLASCISYLVNIHFPDAVENNLRTT